MVDKQEHPFEPQLFLTQVGRGRRIVKHGEGEVIFSQGDPADCVYYMQQGTAKVSIYSKQGKEAVVALLRERDFFGEGCLAGQPRRLGTVTALTDCVMTRIDKALVVRVLKDQPAFSEMFITHILTQAIRVQEDLVDQLFNPSEKRLARILLLLANFGKDGQHEPVVTKVSQETLAEMVGTTRSRVNYFMNKFRRLGFIHYNGDLRIHSSLLNVILHG